MAALVEDARWRTSARGRRYLMAVCSDASGQFMASCFDDDIAPYIEEAAKAGGCGLLSVELDRKDGEETPRVTIRSIRPFEGMTMMNTRLRLVVVMEQADAAPALAALLAGTRGHGGRAELTIDAALPGGGRQAIQCGRDFSVDAELVALIEKVPGIAAARLGAIDPPRLALVG
jgi:DNA polymerase-3 subunit alpha